MFYTRFFKRSFGYILIAILFLFLGRRLFPERTYTTNVVTKTVMKYVPKYVYHTLTDTIIKWRTKILYKKIKPETTIIYKQHINVVKIWGKWPEAIVSLNYKSSRLNFTSLNDDSTLRHYSYKDVVRGFKIRSLGKGFYVLRQRRQIFYRPHVYLGVEKGSRYQVYMQSEMRIWNFKPEIRISDKGLSYGIKFELW